MIRGREWGTFERGRERKERKQIEKERENDRVYRAMLHKKVHTDRQVRHVSKIICKVALPICRLFIKFYSIFNVLFMSFLFLEAQLFCS